MAATNITRVAVDLKKFAQAIEVGLGVAVEKLGRDLHGLIVKRTPVDTGRAQGAWDVTTGSPSTKKPPAGPTTSSFPALAITGKESLFIVNNVEYIEPLENGHSDQAPIGMVRVSVAETEAKIDTILQGLAAEAESKV